MVLGVTLVDFGANTTNIAVYYGSSLRHSATIPIGSASITNDIAVMLQISVSEAEKIKKIMLLPFQKCHRINWR